MKETIKDNQDNTISRSKTSIISKQVNRTDINENDVVLLHFPLDIGRNNYRCKYEMFSLSL